MNQIRFLSFITLMFQSIKLEFLEDIERSLPLFHMISARFSACIIHLFFLCSHQHFDLSNTTLSSPFGPTFTPPTFRFLSASFQTIFRHLTKTVSRDLRSAINTLNQLPSLTAHASIYLGDQTKMLSDLWTPNWKKERAGNNLVSGVRRADRTWSIWPEALSFPRPVKKGEQFSCACGGKEGTFSLAP